MILPEIKPLLTLKVQYRIPAPYRAWCHVCNNGFMFIDELAAHKLGGDCEFSKVGPGEDVAPAAEGDCQCDIPNAGLLLTGDEICQVCGKQV